ncbi:MAG: diacylglycerol kinase [Desulfurivibrio sp.]|nr:diacylglycerol kinase [Desulfurivibrio sp.]
MNKPGERHLRRLRKAWGWSFKGLASALRYEEAFRQEVFLFCLLAPVAFFLGEDGIARALMIGSLLLVLIVELLNTAVESVVDRIGSESHPLSGRAKDVGSAAVFLALANVILVWTLVLLP